MKQSGNKTTKQNLLDEAINQFSTKGYYGTTTDGIAKIIGVTQPCVIYHFRSKLNLWTQCVLHLADKAPNEELNRIVLFELFANSKRLNTLKTLKKTNATLKKMEKIYAKIISC